MITYQTFIMQGFLTCENCCANVQGANVPFFMYTEVHFNQAIEVADSQDDHSQTCDVKKSEKVEPSSKKKDEVIINDSTMAMARVDVDAGNDQHVQDGTPHHRNEVKEYQDMRTSEACWRLFQFPMSDRYPAVTIVPEFSETYDVKKSENVEPSCKKKDDRITNQRDTDEKK